jgi:DNA primase
MNSIKAKQLDLVNFLKKIGYEPKKTNNIEAWFLSPFRAENSPSFKVNINRNIWFDFGEGIGGNIIDLVVRIENCSVKEALFKLSNESFSFHKQINFNNINNSYTIHKITEITNHNLISFINSRKINIEVAKKYCFQIHYSFQNTTEYYGIGFKNDNDGFEIRSKYFKGCLGKKEITNINNNSSTIVIFESWSDFLSYLTLKIDNENYIVLNSTSMTNRVLSNLNNYKLIKLFLDNDEAGNKATNTIISSINIDVIDCRYLYKNFKDLNEYLINNFNRAVDSQSWL